MTRHGHGSVASRRQAVHEVSELRAQPLVELPMERDAHEQEGRSDVDGEYRGEHRDVPQRETGPYMAGPQAHGQDVDSPIMNPTPRTVWISLGSAGSSPLRPGPAHWSSAESRGVTIHTGMPRWRLLIVASTSRPSRPGSIRSSTTRSNGPESSRK